MKDYSGLTQTHDYQEQAMKGKLRASTRASIIKPSFIKEKKETSLTLDLTLEGTKNIQVSKDASSFHKDDSMRSHESLNTESDYATLGIQVVHRKKMDFRLIADAMQNI
ncbi:hypothetical protein XENOCAPTIV_002705 [Xenoophorus captivus]|uniref:Uncharacterized protein n=1 Tax=Xenoophorus captivus TaxID=1517983 RepID=A0ABV0RBY1_9TELE